MENYATKPNASQENVEKKDELLLKIMFSIRKPNYNLFPLTSNKINKLEEQKIFAENGSKLFEVLFRFV